ncbi:MAG: GNAT family N-acetyltransferase [Sphingobacterium sp.]
MERVIELKKYVKDDLPDYQQLVRCSEVMYYITGLGMDGIQSKAKFSSILSINNQQHSIGYFQVLDQNTKDVLGECKLVYYLDDPTVFEIGYLLKKEYWRQGLGSKICQDLLNLAQYIDPTKDIIGIIHPENTASKRLLEKFGFRSFFRGFENGLPTEKFIKRATLK